MKIHQVVLYIIDHDDLGAASVRQHLEDTHYPNNCMSPRVAQVQTRDVEYDERGPLNKSDDRVAVPAFAEAFADRHTCRGFFGLPPADGKPCPMCTREEAATTRVRVEAALFKHGVHWNNGSIEPTAALIDDLIAAFGDA